MSFTKLFFPIILLAVTLFGAELFQTILSFQDMNALTQAKEKQESSISSIKKLQDQVDALAFGTLKLSQKGNSNAAEVIEKFKKAGITIKGPDSSAPSSTNH